MKHQYFSTLEEARDVAFSREKSFLRGLRNPVGSQYSSYWNGEAPGHYIFQSKHGFRLSKRYPADLSQGYFINPNVNGFDGSSPIQASADMIGVVAIVLTLQGGWREAEINHRSLFKLWSMRIDGPVFVQIQSNQYPWYRRYWLHTAQQCMAYDRRTGVESCELEWSLAVSIL